MATERARVAEKGWGAALLALQDPDGRWDGSLYSPKWTSTTYTLLLLHWLGLPTGNPQAVAGCRRLWDGAGYFSGGLNIAKSARLAEACITGMFVLLAASFGYPDARVDPAVRWLLGATITPTAAGTAGLSGRGSRHGSFHTSITVLDALLCVPGAVLPMSRRGDGGGREFFLDHRLYRSHRTGEVVNPAMTRFPFPPQWHFDVLRGLEHFRAAWCARGRPAVGCRRGGRARPPPRRSVAALPRLSGRNWFAMEEPGPSRWATLRALRVLDWWARSR